jgi:molybdopterin converting factor small subunit
MKVHLKGSGDLRDYLGRASQEIELGDGSSFADLLGVIGERWGMHLPPFMWDAQQKRFRGAVFLVVNKHVVQDLDEPLEDGSEVTVMRALSGG